MEDQEEPLQQVLLHCWRCDADIFDDEQQTQLLCHHRMHTACFLQIAHLDFNCPHCNEPINPNGPAAQFQHHESDVEGARIRNLYETNEAFKTLAQKIAKKRSLASKSQTAYTKLIKTKKEEIRNQLLAIKAQLEGLTETKKTEIKESTIYKEYMSANRGYNLLLGKMRTEYNCSERKLGRALQEKQGFRRFTPFRYSRFYRSPLNRAFYYHIRI
jgi:hypothetical protein